MWALGSHPDYNEQGWEFGLTTIYKKKKLVAIISQYIGGY